MQKSFQGLVPQPPYPWLDDLWRQFVERSRSNKVPHAILISGKGGSGEFDLGYAMAQFLLCASPTALSACGACKSCRLMQSDAHPDLVSVCPEEKSTVIKIDAIRSVAAFVANTAQQGGKKLVVLGPAESMNANAANALLKNLEEPSGDTTFILVSSNPLLLMATIRSRCSQWVVRSPTAAQSVEWLERNSVTDAEAKLNLTGGEPLRVMEWVEKGLYEQSEALERLTGQYVDGHLDLVQAAKKISGYSPLWVLDQWILRTQSAIKSSGNAEAPTAAFAFVDLLLRRKGQLLRGNNPNVQLLVEELLLGFKEC